MDKKSSNIGSLEGLLHTATGANAIQKRESLTKPPAVDERPSICGQFSNWLPKKMYRIEEFTKIHKNTTMKFIFDRMEKMGLPVNRKVKNPKLLDYGMKQNYTEMAEEYEKEFLI
jgi:hypothetical protein